jgi:lysophospholipase L1-like esterase
MNEVTITYRNAGIELGKRLDTAVLDTWEAFKDVEPKCVLIDGLHFNARGNALLFAALLELIRSAFPELEEIADVAPDWKLLG